jgi:multidrug efflux system membrane fusion protein
MRNIRIALGIAAALAAGLAVAATAAEPSRSGRSDSFTKPSRDFTLSFVRAGLIAQLDVKEGDLVKKGQVLAQLEDSAERENLAQLKAQADDEVRVKAARAELEQKKIDLKKYELAAAKGAATELELQHAQLDVTIAELTLDLSKFQHEQDIRKYKEAQLQVDRMRILSPIDGKVEQVFVNQGNAVDALAKVIRVVQIDPLWVDAPVARDSVRQLGLKCGDTCDVEFLSDSGIESTGNAGGKVVHVGAVADPGSNTLTVRLEVPNPANRAAGEHVKLRFGATAATTRQAQLAEVTP